MHGSVPHAQYCRRRPCINLHSRIIYFLWGGVVQGNTPLRNAVDNQHESVLRLLVEKGADVCVADAKVWGVAKRQGDTPVCSVLPCRVPCVVCEASAGRALMVGGAWLLPQLWVLMCRHGRACRRMRMPVPHTLGAWGA